MPIAATPRAAEPSQLVAHALSSVTGIASLPEVTARVIQTVEDPRSNARQLNQIISHDPALVTRILKVVNSSFYGLPGQIASVERAIVMLGLSAVRNIAVASGMGQMFRGARLCEAFDAKDLWTHCVGVAVLSREIGRQIQANLADECFLAGMIHDVGLLVSLQVWPEKLRQVCDEVTRTGRPFCEVETQVIGVDHQQLGAAIAAKWQFPKPCQQVAGLHHETGSTAETQRQLVRVVRLADEIAAGTDLAGFNLTTAGDQADALAAGLGLADGTTDALRQRLPELLQAASDLKS